MSRRRASMLCCGTRSNIKLCGLAMPPRIDPTRARSHVSRRRPDDDFNVSKRRAVGGKVMALTSPRLREVSESTKGFSDCGIDADRGLPDVGALVKRIASRAARVGVIGLGYVGLPLACLAADRRFVVVGFEVEETKIAALNKGRSYIRHIPDETVAALASRLAL